MAISRLEILMKKVEQMQKALGVKTGGSSIQAPKKATEYEEALFNARNSLKIAEDKLEERNRKIEIYGKQSEERIRNDIEIMDLMKESEEAIKWLENTLVPLEKKLSAEEYQKMYKPLLLMQEQYDIIKSESEGGEPYKKKKHVEIGLTAQKQALMPSPKDYDREMTVEELNAMDRFKKRDAEIDDLLVIIIQNIDLLHEKAVNIDNAIDRNHKILEEVNKHADHTGSRLDNINTRMKDILKKFAEPDRMCIYIVLLFVAIILIMILSSQIKNT